MTTEDDQQIEALIEAQPDAVRREAAVDTAGERPHLVQRISQSYPTTTEDLWEACTTADRLARWFAPVSGDLRLGGRYQVEGNASGEVLACDPPRTLTLSWEFGGESSQVILSLEPEGERTRLTLQHTADVDPDFWARFGPGATGVGWDLSLLGLALHLGTGFTRPEDPEAFSRTEPARRFLRESSDRWTAVSVAARTPEADARAAGARTTAFYLGESDDPG